MINLLPLEEKKVLVQEKKYRLTLILGTLLLLFLLCLILILFSIKIYISGQLESQKIILSQAEREFEQSEIRDLQEKIIFANQTFPKLISFYQEKFSFTEILERISKTLPSGIYLTNLSFNSLIEEKFRGQISLTGFSPSREVLFEFKENLEAEKDFQEIYFPPANWVKPTDIDFNLTFKIK